VGHLNWPYATPVEFSPDGRTLATFATFATDGQDNSVRLWDTSSGRLRTTLTGPLGDVTSVDFSWVQFL
jgi:WD40 repeat protein